MREKIEQKDDALSEERLAKADAFLAWAEGVGMRRLVKQIRDPRLTLGNAWLAYLRCALARYRWAKGERQV